jgi:hypothetical protein
MRIYKHFQSHIIVLHQHVSATSVTIFRVSCNKNKINIIIKKYMVKIYDKTTHCYVNFLWRIYWSENNRIVL